MVVSRARVVRNHATPPGHRTCLRYSTTCLLRRHNSHRLIFIAGAELGIDWNPLTSRLKTAAQQLCAELGIETGWQVIGHARNNM